MIASSCCHLLVFTNHIHLYFLFGLAFGLVGTTLSCRVVSCHAIPPTPTYYLRGPVHELIQCLQRACTTTVCTTPVVFRFHPCADVGGGTATVCGSACVRACESVEKPVPRRW